MSASWSLIHSLGVGFKFLFVHYIFFIFVYILHFIFTFLIVNIKIYTIFFFQNMLKRDYQLMVHNPVSTLGRITSATWSLRSEVTQEFYPGPGLRWGVIPYILLLLLFMVGIPRARDYYGVWSGYREFIYLRIDGNENSLASPYIHGGG
mgnify:CR=1 FL=1